MAGTPYALNYLAPQARDAARDLRMQYSDGMLPQHGPVCPPQIVDTAELSSGLYVCSMSGRWFQVVSADAGSTHFLARELTDDGLSAAGWLPADDGWDLLTAQEVRDWQADVDRKADQDMLDRDLRWGGGWED